MPTPPMTVGLPVDNVRRYPAGSLEALLGLTEAVEGGPETVTTERWAS